MTKEEGGHEQMLPRQELHKALVVANPIASPIAKHILAMAGILKKAVIRRAASLLTEK